MVNSVEKYGECMEYAADAELSMKSFGEVESSKKVQAWKRNGGFFAATAQNRSTSGSTHGKTEKKSFWSLWGFSSEEREKNKRSEKIQKAFKEGRYEEAFSLINQLTSEDLIMASLSRGAEYLDLEVVRASSVLKTEKLRSCFFSYFFENLFATFGNHPTTSQLDHALQAIKTSNCSEEIKRECLFRLGYEALRRRYYLLACAIGKNIPKTKQTAFPRDRFFETLLKEALAARQMDAAEKAWKQLSSKELCAKYSGYFEKIETKTEETKTEETKTEEPSSEVKQVKKSNRRRNLGLAGLITFVVLAVAGVLYLNSKK